ncbi:MAG: hypothetical protein KJ623_01260 [Nanoarchaeota archaeon]|nr:hypothetical protein [Nanoarchaeota archaeon]MBU0962732.1 hypothetical protein [Nanoarchaeota archaeon]
MIEFDIYELIYNNEPHDPDDLDSEEHLSLQAISKQARLPEKAVNLYLSNLIEWGFVTSRGEGFATSDFLELLNEHIDNFVDNYLKINPNPICIYFPKVSLSNNP